MKIAQSLAESSLERQSLQQQQLVRIELSPPPPKGHFWVKTSRSCFWVAWDTKRLHNPDKAERI